MAWVQNLVRELRSCKLQGAAKKKKTQKGRCSEKHIVNRLNLRRFTGQDKGSPKKINQEVQVGWMAPEETGHPP